MIFHDLTQFVCFCLFFFVCWLQRHQWISVFRATQCLYTLVLYCHSTLMLSDFVCGIWKKNKIKKNSIWCFNASGYKIWKKDFCCIAPLLKLTCHIRVKDPEFLNLCTPVTLTLQNPFVLFTKNDLVSNQRDPFAKGLCLTWYFKYHKKTFIWSTFGGAYTFWLMHERTVQWSHVDNKS